LPVDSNVITLQATHSVGQAASTSITVIVDDDLDLPGPTLTAGPAQIGWHIGAGTITVQTDQISIGNAGSGRLTWTASSDQSWLTLSAASGTVATADPTPLGLTVNPAGLQSGKTYSAHLTLTMPASGSTAAQTVVVLVSLSIGDVWNHVKVVTTTSLYLPVVQR